MRTRGVPKRAASPLSRGLAPAWHVRQVLTRDVAQAQVSTTQLRRRSREAVDSFMEEVTSQAVEEMKRLLREVRDESGSGLVEACQRRVRSSLREKEVWEA